MALIKCLECNKNVSTKAINCPHCGAPILKEEKDIELKKASNEEFPLSETLEIKDGNNKKLFTFGIIAIVLLVGIIGYTLYENGTLENLGIVSSTKEDDEKETHKDRNPDNLNQIKVKKPSLIVREEPDDDSEKIGKIYEDDIYNIIAISYAEDKDIIIYEIEYKDESGYIITSKDETDIEIILNNNEYKTIEDMFNPPLTEEEIKEKLAETVLDNGYYEDDTEDNVFYNTVTEDSDTGYIYGLDLNDNIYSYLYIDAESYIFVTYYYLEDRVVLQYAYDYYGDFTTIMEYNYNILTGDITCDEAIEGMCDEADRDGVIEIMDNLVEMFNEIEEDAEVDVSGIQSGGSAI